MRQSILGSVAAITLLAACSGGADDSAKTAPAPDADAEASTDAAEAQTSSDVALEAGDDFQARLQTALIQAEEGSTITLPAGKFMMTDGLSLDVDGVTLTGAGQGETILDFSGQRGSGEGLLVTSDDVTLTDFTIQETKGDGIKSKGADRIIYRDLTVEWLGEPDEVNGAYGVYPVESTDVLVEDVTVRGASDAGIYVGQSDKIIVRDSTAEYNVAGIEIENSTNAEVYGNEVTNNTGGILVFDLPDLPVMGGNSTKIYDNNIHHNNTRNFAPKGNIVAGVPAGTGVIIMANDKVEVTGNTFDQNQTAQVLVTAYTEEFTDEDYNPLPRNVYVHGNTYGEGGKNPQGLLGEFAMLLGGEVPAIVWDGVTRWHDGEDVDVNLVIDEDEGVGFVNLGLGAYPVKLTSVSPNQDRPDSEPFGTLDPVKLSHAE
ncbi:parallel beta-helix domain-containing protein [Henriciella litoralis]|uniref:parallel beta-helix domain-containing protein n=1 Tax=Henriciella litoralis TaxID=568102 RepID=UPI0009FE48ED|nr:parallel beta-helix domain-containing protein [Henriciella litoralis]